MTSQSSSSTLLVFARASASGKVKTRLAAAVGAAEALSAHLACTRDAIRLGERVRGCRRRLLLTGGEQAWREGGIAPGAGWETGRQQGRSLGERLQRGFAEAFALGARKVVAIGTDTPWMGRERIETALDWLERDDAVLGPCADGGYYLVGTRLSLAAIFRGIGWGGRSVLAATRLAIERAGASYRLLPPDFDLDRPEDIARAWALLCREPWRSPALAKWLEAGASGARDRARRSTLRPKPSRPGK